MRRILGSTLVMEAALVLLLEGKDQTEQNIVAFARRAVSPELQDDEALIESVRHSARELLQAAPSNAPER